ncbi:MAG: ATP-dependent Clp protease proteolytic subunit [Deltaproteobacteria bacterium]|nr:ATP-dependent Clp protease proteolytic subunit [Deltaproteobacteria bacterium]MDD9852930.1 ATP-dependent Clp protease proteolytic subunit [Deltaproteobacteria bacterium]
MEQSQPESGAPQFPKIAERLFESRTVLIYGEITPRTAQLVVAQLLALSADGKDDITVFLHSEGGHVESGDAIHDMIRFIAPRVRMVGTGWVASAGTHIYLAAPKEDRFCLPNTRFMIHQPLGGVGGSASDIRIEAEEILKARERLNRSIAEATGQPLEKVAQDTDRNHWMTPEEARDYGIVGRIIHSVGEIQERAPGGNPPAAE